MERKKICVDRHHEALFRSFQILFEERLEWELYEPGGIEWFDSGNWLIGQPYGETARNTALQFLESVIPTDGTEQLFPHRGISFDEFKRTPFDLMIASYVDHIPVYRRLIDQYHPRCKLIAQLGNEWILSSDQLNMVDGVMASIKPFQINNKPVVFYHQEFRPLECRYSFPNLSIYSFVNALNINEIFRQDWSDFLELEKSLPEFTCRSYGGGCRDGSLPQKDVLFHMQHAMFMCHFKTGGDGFGHNLYSAASMGIPIIYKGSQYKNKLGEELLSHMSTGIDLDKLGSISELARVIRAIDPDMHRDMSITLSNVFKDRVNFDQEAKKIAQFLELVLA